MKMSKYMLSFNRSGSSISYTIFKLKNNIYQKVFWKAYISSVNNSHYIRLINSLNTLITFPINKLLKDKDKELMRGFIKITDKSSKSFGSEYTHYFISDALGDFLECIHIWIEKLNKSLADTGNDLKTERYLLDMLRLMEDFNYIRKIEDRKLKELTEELMNYITLYYI